MERYKRTDESTKMAYVLPGKPNIANWHARFLKMPESEHKYFTRMPIF